eukprot:gnl/MRDRNA2_/MRDRNA2_24105_c0_seq1.p1 gnl/MRDRNA2_/MRDRNA2_24105_c0~~gnl/MRDRNA2_/MRDRNA2_24105_c0_seq1.p1  ORF type:complete len:315 (-),score=80.75 gnl/MRDRNA2_/MRDRNA2_24105_c0_seq1:258-1202(-)
MTLIVDKITQKYSADNDLLDQVLDQASRGYEKAFLSDRLTKNMAEDQDFSCDCSSPQEHFDYEFTDGVEISEQLFNLMQELKFCNTSTIREECEDVSNEDMYHDLELQMQEDVRNMPELLALKEGELLEDALERAAQQYEMSFALDRVVMCDMEADDAELFYDCNELIVDDDTLKMYMPTTASTCSISDNLFDMVQEVKSMHVKEVMDLDGLIVNTLDMESELELSMLEDMSKLSLSEIAEPSTVSSALAPHPKQMASARNKLAVTCSLPLTCFVNARSPCGGVPCGTPKRVTASPANAAWRSPASAAWRSQRI